MSDLGARSHRHGRTAAGRHPKELHSVLGLSRKRDPLAIGRDNGTLFERGSAGKWLHGEEDRR